VGTHRQPLPLRELDVAGVPIAGYARDVVFTDRSDGEGLGGQRENTATPTM
jgi:hypothetical protein